MKNLSTPSQFKMVDDVAEFHNKILQQPVPESPSLVSLEFGIERLRFMQEELDEYVEAVFKGDMVGAADALMDIVYVALGTAHLMSLPVPELWNAVQKANMAKVSGPTKRGNKYDAMKPKGWVGPEAEMAAAIGRAIDASVN